ncbi:MAG: hypothetical protein IPO22_14440 [Anaerolineales bacterium]|nr:hypothetical protein [Anaerolineales bacterium]
MKEERIGGILFLVQGLRGSSWNFLSNVLFHVVRVRSVRVQKLPLIPN